MKRQKMKRIHYLCVSSEIRPIFLSTLSSLLQLCATFNRFPYPIFHALPSIYAYSLSKTSYQSSYVAVKERLGATETLFYRRMLRIPTCQQRPSLYGKCQQNGHLYFISGRDSCNFQSTLREKRAQKIWLCKT